MADEIISKSGCWHMFDVNLGFETSLSLCKINYRFVRAAASVHSTASSRMYVFSWITCHSGGVALLDECNTDSSVVCVLEMMAGKT